MKLTMTIHNVKAIDYFTMDFPLEQGLYAITGENGSGKSTVVTCASTVFFNMPMYEYFGRPNGAASIEFSLNGATRSWTYTHGKWLRTTSSSKRMNIKGFYEGSIVFGNRFRDTSFQTIKKLDNFSEHNLDPADEFVKSNLGRILRDDPDYYNQLFRIKKSDAYHIYDQLN